MQINHKLMTVAEYVEERVIEAVPESNKHYNAVTRK